MRKLNPLHYLYVLLILISGLLPACSFGQYTPDSLRSWISELATKDNSVNPVVDYLNNKVVTASEADKLSLRLALNQHKEKSNSYFTVRKYLLMVNLVRLDSSTYYYKEAINTAYELGDDELIAYASWQYGSRMNLWRVIEPAVMYCLNAADLYEKVGKPMSGRQYRDLADALYFIREYRKSVYYARKATTLLHSDFFGTTCANTVALGYQKLGIYDSAIIYYDSAILLLKNVDNDSYKEIWKGIVSGNKGQIYFLQGDYKTALPLFEYDFHQSITHNEFDNAANTLQWAARTNLALGNTATALQQIREAFQWMKKRPEQNYLQNLYYTAELIYRQAGITDSAFYFARHYQNLHDSIEAKVANSKLEISRIKLENEKNYYDIKSFKQHREKAILYRNLIIVAIILLAIIALLFMNGQRRKSLYHQQIMAEKNRHAEQEIATAKEQLATFRKTVAEKTGVIEQLEAQLNSSTLNKQQHEILSSLLQSTIITDEQWISFKNLLEKIYPGFFHRLKEGYPGITMAEQRMAAFTKLKLSTKETAAMLGISVESVHKTRQRLKQRLKLSPEENLEEYVAAR